MDSLGETIHGSATKLPLLSLLEFQTEIRVTVKKKTNIFLFNKTQGAQCYIVCVKLHHVPHVTSPVHTVYA